MTCGRRRVAVARLIGFPKLALASALPLTVVTHRRRLRRVPARCVRHILRPRTRASGPGRRHLIGTEDAAGDLDRAFCPIGAHQLPCRRRVEAADAVVLRNPHAAPSAPRRRKTVAAERPEGPGLHGRRLMMALRRQTLDGALTVLLRSNRRSLAPGGGSAPRFVTQAKAQVVMVFDPN